MNALRSIAEVKKKTEHAISEIDTIMCRMVFTNLPSRASSFLVNEGHFENL